jgi:four helix bundle protein
VKEAGPPRDIKERTFSFALEVVRLCRSLDSRAGSFRTLAQQLLRSGTSVGANVEEAQAGQSRADFISKYSIALKEARETLYWLRLLDASGELSNGSCNLLLKEADEIARIIASIIVRTKKGARG